MPASRIPEIVDRLEAAVHDALLAGARLVVESAKERVPVDPNAKTHLRDAIHIKEDEEGIWIVAGNRKHWWAHILEHGSVKMAPHPFLVPALEEHREQILLDVREAIRLAVEG